MTNLVFAKGYTINVLDHGFVRYVDHMGSDMDVVEAARVSYQSPSKGADADQKLLEFLYRNRHSSPFEMVKVKVNIKMPIFVARQYIRHRMQNFNEVSARYTQLPKEFYIPGDWRYQDDKNRQSSFGNFNPHLPGARIETASEALLRHCHESYKLYEDLLESGVAREMARMVLPLNIYTECYACWDMKNLLHFITLRDDSHAQAEIQEYGKAIKAICEKLFPWIMSAYEKYKWLPVENPSQIGL